jgi:hypothetical protein
MCKPVCAHHVVTGLYLTDGSAWLQLDDIFWITTPLRMRTEWLAPGGSCINPTRRKTRG